MNKITITVNGVDYEYNITNPLKHNDVIEEINGKWYIVHYPEGTEFWIDGAECWENK